MRTLSDSREEIVTFMDVTRPYGKSWDFIYNALKHVTYYT